MFMDFVDETCKVSIMYSILMGTHSSQKQVHIHPYKDFVSNAMISSTEKEKEKGKDKRQKTKEKEKEECVNEFSFEMYCIAFERIVAKNINSS